MARSDGEWAECARVTLTLYAAAPMELPAGAERQQAATQLREQLVRHG